MRYLALACDFDGTLASEGRVDARTVEAMEKLLASGRKLILVTGRILEDLLAIFPRTDLFECIVAENGAVLYRPGTREVRALGPAPPEKFFQSLKEKGVTSLSRGRVIVATVTPHEKAVLEAIRRLGIEYQVIFNKGSVMVLPSGLNKARGLEAALEDLGLSPHNVVGVGDAENDESFLRACECAVAVAGALPGLKETADYVTAGDDGEGVREVIDALLSSDLHEIDRSITRHHLLLGHRPGGDEFRVPPFGVNLLLSGPSGSGKSTLASGLLERLAEARYQYCVIDPEGDQEALEDAVSLGNGQRPVTVPEAVKLLSGPGQNAVINLVGMRIDERPAFFQALLPHLQELRARTGRPHWIVVDGAHHLMSAGWAPAAVSLPREFTGTLFITLHPRLLAAPALAGVDLLLAVGKDPAETLRDFCEAQGLSPPPRAPIPSNPHHVLAWDRWAKSEPFLFEPAPSRGERRRHRRKY